MLLHKNHHFIYNCRAAVQLPNNVYFDPCPDPCPVEGIVFYSEDTRITVDMDFIESEKEERAFLAESIEDSDSYQILKPISKLSTNELKGFTMTYASKRHIYEEYVFTIPCEEPTLLNICLQQEKDKLSDPKLYEALQKEIIAGISLVEG